MDIEAVFDNHNDEFLKFDRVENKLSQRPDLHAFLLLDSLVPRNRDMVASACHDEIWLDIDVDELAQTAITEDQIRDLVRCGVRVDESALCMFV